MSFKDLVELSFEKFDDEFDSQLSKESNISKKYNSCILRAKEYKHLAQLDGIRQDMGKRAEKYYNMAQGFKEK